MNVEYEMSIFAKWICVAAALLVAAPAFAQSPPSPHPCTASTHVFCVTNTSDDNTATGPAGSLRRAISDSNTNGGANTIDFDIVGTGPFTITLVAQLPAINADGNLTSLLIDGYSQAGSAVNTNAPDQGGLNGALAIELVGAGFDGLFYYCCPFPKIDLTFQGLALRGFYVPIAGQSNGLTQ